MNTKVRKRDGRIVDFNKQFIINAIAKAFISTDGEEYDDYAKDKAEKIAEYVQNKVEEYDGIYTVEDVQDMVEKGLMACKKKDVAKNYILYRDKRKADRNMVDLYNTMGNIVYGRDEYWLTENSNKNSILNTTQRDYMAGEVSTRFTMDRILPDNIVKAHREGIIHVHDCDYEIQRMTNCCLINLDDMLQNGTVISNTLIEKPRSFKTACTVTTQIIAQVASNQYGGQSISLEHLAPFVDVSRKKIMKEVRDEADKIGLNYTEDQINKIVSDRLKKEVKDGIQTIQYQILTLLTTNGQTPFITIFMDINSTDDSQEKEDLALLIEEVLKQRIQGVKNEKGVYITCAFPKLIYTLDDNNIYPDSKYYYLTKLAAKCTAKRMVPDYISAKVMRELKGDVYPCMGCVDGQEIITYKLFGQTYTESFEKAWKRMATHFEVKNQSGSIINKYIDCEGVEIYDSKQGYVPCFRFIRNRQNEWMQITLRNGRTIRCTSDHPFETENRGIVRAKDLTTDDVIAINKKAITGKNIPVNPDYAWLLGMILCDGSYDGTLFVSLGLDENDIAIKFKKAIKNLYNLECHTNEHHRGIKGNYNDLIVNSDGTSTLCDLISHLHAVFQGKQKKLRQMPNNFLDWNENARIALLAGMIDADGYVNQNPAHAIIQIGSTNKALAIQQMYLAQSLGMKASLYVNKFRSNKKECVRYRVEFRPTGELIEALASEKKKANFKNNARNNASPLSDEVVNVAKIETFNYEDFSYDVTTQSEHFEVSGIYSHNCRSFLTPDRFTENGWNNREHALNSNPEKHKYYGRFNQGVVTLNLPDIAFSSGGDFDKFWKLFDERAELCHRALQIRHKHLLGTPSDVAPILWQYGAYARLDKHEKIDKLLYHGYSTISLGYAGLYECVKYMTGHSHTDGDIGEKFGLQVMQALNDKCNQWKETEDIDYSPYGSPIESTTYKFAKCLKKRFGDDVFVKLDGKDRNYITNSYHVYVGEEVNIFDKLKLESKFQKLSPGGAISYGEVPNLQHNIPAVLEVLKYIYDNIMYAELNTKSDYCQKCGYDGEIKIIDDNGKLDWECPQCGNRDHDTLNVCRRTCGYLGTNFWNQGRTNEIKDRVVHLDDKELVERKN